MELNHPRRTVLVIAACLLLALTAPLGGQSNLNARLDGAIRSAGVAITGVSVGDQNTKSTWKVTPPTLQTAAQPTIDGFNVNDPALIDAELDAVVKAAVDNERLTSAIVWTIIDTYSPPATIAKYTTARTKIINSYKTRPWLP